MKSLIIGVVCLMLAACGAIRPHQIPVGCENSVIYKAMPAPEAAGSTLILGTQIMIQKYPESKKYVANAFKVLDELLQDPSVTYTDVVRVLNDCIVWINAYYGEALLVATLVDSWFTAPVQINSCDLDLFKRFTKMGMDSLK